MRADVYLTVNRHAASREQAKRLIAGGCVAVDGRTLCKPSEEIAEGAHRVEVRDAMPYVGRGGLKLEAALDAFGLEVAGWPSAPPPADLPIVCSAAARRGYGRWMPARVSLHPHCGRMAA